MPIASGVRRAPTSAGVGGANAVIRSSFPGLSRDALGCSPFKERSPEARATKRRLQAQGRSVTLKDEHPDETLDAFAARYLRAKSATFSPHTIKSIETEYRLRIAPSLGHLRLSEVTRERIEIWLADLVGVASSRRMVTQGGASLRMILATAVSWGRISANPASRVRLPALDTHEEQ